MTAPYAALARRIARTLRPHDGARRRALAAARELVRHSSRLIRSLHRDAPDRDAWRRLETAAQRLRRELQKSPRLVAHGAVQQSFGEYAEAALLRAFLTRTRPPSMESLDVPAEAFALGLADFVGELRRVFLNRVLADDLPGAFRAFDSMEKAYEALADVDIPEGLVSIRAKLDADRALLERTRGDLVTAKKAKTLENKIDGVGRLLDEAEGSTQKRPAKKPDDELDLDAAWSKP